VNTRVVTPEALRAAVRRLRDGLSAELAGLNEDEADAALRYAADRLAEELTRIRLLLTTDR